MLWKDTEKNNEKFTSSSSFQISVGVFFYCSSLQIFSNFIHEIRYSKTFFSQIFMKMAKLNQQFEENQKLLQYFFQKVSDTNFS